MCQHSPGSLKHFGKANSSLVFPWDNIPAHKSINTELSLQELIPLKPRSPESPDQSLQTCSILPSLDQEFNLTFKSCLWMRPETIARPLVNISQCLLGERRSDPKVCRPNSLLLYLCVHRVVPAQAAASGIPRASHGIRFGFPGLEERVHLLGEGLDFPE